MNSLATGMSLVFPGLLLPACSSGAPRPEGVVHRDSGGIEIIEYSATALEAAPLYAVSETFDLAIGLADGEAPYVFGRIGAAAELSDSTIAIFDDMANELRFFSSDGAFLGAVGRRGEGPREFSAIDGWWHGRGDTLLAWDRQLNRLAVIGERGAVFDLVPVQLHGRQIDYFMGMYPDGSMLFLDQSFERASDGSRTETISMLRLSRPAGGKRGERKETSPELPRETGGRAVWSAEPIVRHGIPHPPESAGMPLFRARTSGGIHPDGVWLSPGSEPEIRLYDTSGVLRRLVRWDGGDRTLTASRWEAYVASALEPAAPDRQVELRASLEARPRPELLPATAFAVSDMSGRTWVMRFEPPGEDLAGELLVFSAQGELEARIEHFQPVEPLPRALDAVWQRGTDEVGAPRATRHRLVRADTNR